MGWEEKMALALKTRRGLSIASSGLDAYNSVSDALDVLLDTKEEVIEAIETIQAESEPDPFETFLREFLNDR